MYAEVFQFGTTQGLEQKTFFDDVYPFSTAFKRNAYWLNVTSRSSLSIYRNRFDDLIVERQ